MRAGDPCGCFPSGRHYPGIAHLVRLRAAGVAEEFDGAVPWRELPIALLDVETTGTDAASDRIVEVGIAVGRGGEIVARHAWLVDPGRPIPAQATAVHGIRDEDVAGQATFRDVAEEILRALDGTIPAAYNASFDRAFLLAELERAEVSVEHPPGAARRSVDWIDPLVWARALHRDLQVKSLGEVAARLGVRHEKAHRAYDDAEAALRVLYAMAEDARVPVAYGKLIERQRQLQQEQDEARRLWRRPS